MSLVTFIEYVVDKSAFLGQNRARFIKFLCKTITVFRANYRVVRSKIRRVTIFFPQSLAEKGDNVDLNCDGMPRLYFEVTSLACGAPISWSRWPGSGLGGLPPVNGGIDQSPPASRTDRALRARGRKRSYWHGHTLQTYQHFLSSR